VLTSAIALLMSSARLSRQYSQQQYNDLSKPLSGLFGV